MSKETGKQKKGILLEQTSTFSCSDIFDLYCSWNMLPELALEAHDMLRGEHGGEIPGVSLTEETTPLATIHTVKILDAQGSRIMQKPEGTYVTIYSESLMINHRGIQQELIQLLISYLQPFVQLHTLSDGVLVAGLGNWKSTPDSLGPRLIHQLTATRHLHGNVPQQLLDGVRPITTIAPGVLGMTGIESAEILKGIVDRVQPKLIIVIDALAAGDVSRIGTTIQISNTGIAPGAGIGNKRTNINMDTMGVPVLSIGVPTVVKARIIAHNVLEQFWNQLHSRPQTKKLLQELPKPLLQNMMEQALQSCQQNLEVTPKEIDDLIHNCSNILAQAITQVLHPQMNQNFADSFF